MLVHNQPSPPTAENPAAYDVRGWCIYEQRLISLVKNNRSLLELGKVEAGVCERGWAAIVTAAKASRPPPMVPNDFEAMLRAGVEAEAAAPGSGIRFTSGKDLFDAVIPQYRLCFLRLFGSAEELNFEGLDWGCAEVEALVTALFYARAHGATPRSKSLWLIDNEIDDAGAEALGAAIRAGALPALEELFLLGNNIGPAGIGALGSAKNSERGGAPKRSVLNGDRQRVRR